MFPIPFIIKANITALHLIDKAIVVRAWVCKEDHVVLRSLRPEREQRETDDNSEWKRKKNEIRTETKEGESESCRERAGWSVLAGPQRSHRSRLALHQRQETWAACFITFPVESSLTPLLSSESESLPSTIFSPPLSWPEQQWVLSSLLSSDAGPVCLYYKLLSIHHPRLDLAAPSIKCTSPSIHNHSFIIPPTVHVCVCLCCF